MSNAEPSADPRGPQLPGNGFLRLSRLLQSTGRDSDETSAQCAQGPQRQGAIGGVILTHWRRVIMTAERCHRDAWRDGIDVQRILRRIPSDCQGLVIRGVALKQSPYRVTDRIHATDVCVNYALDGRGKSGLSGFAWILRNTLGGGCELKRHRDVHSKIRSVTSRATFDGSIRNQGPENLHWRADRQARRAAGNNVINVACVQLNTCA